MKKAIIGLLTASVFVMGSYIFYSSQKEYKNVIDIKIEKLQVGNEYQIEKPIQKSNSIYQLLTMFCTWNDDNFDWSGYICDK